MDLAKRASDTSGSEQIPFAILVLLVGATGFYQQRQLTARLPKESANSQMAVMGKIFPLIFVVISWTIPAGVVVYFLVSNIWQIGQQAFMFRNQPKPEPGPAAAGKSKKGPTPPASKGKGKPTTTKGARATTKGAKGAKALGGASRGGSTKQGKTPANANQAKANRTNGNKGNGNKGNGSKANGNKPNANKRRPDHGAPRPKGKPSRPGQTPRSEGRPGQTPRSEGRPGPDNPAPDVKKDLPSKSSDGAGSGGIGPETRQPTTPGQHSGSTDKAVGDPADEAVSSPPPLSPAAPSTSTAEPQGSNGSTPLVLPLPPATGDLDKDGE